ncbi:MAG: ketopantoate reductase family protein [Gammaproteobacteria bacterium]|nr:MAG: ketopantoate reductase family protein [Gammaproteobacteria bacterium]RLA16852.1 MAG: ketopantoate reductase family protein [Gammaproteobacteria bacterium]
MRVIILGAGGLGSVFGARLAEQGADVTLVARPTHVEAINKNGLKISGVNGDSTITNITAMSSADDAVGEFDYLILGVKSKDTAATLAGAASLKGRIKTACSFQNNTTKEDDLANWLGAEHVIGFATIEAAQLIEPGHASHTFKLPLSTYFGELDGTITPRIEAIVDICNAAGIGTKAMPNIKQVMWEKITQIANAAGWSVSTLAGNKNLVMNDGMVIQEGAEHYVQYARELISVYKALGYQPENFFAPVSKLKELDGGSFDDAVATVIAIGEGMNKAGMKGRPSMFTDVISGKKTEVEETIGPFVHKARELGISVPTVDAVYRIIKVLDHYLV